MLGSLGSSMSKGYRGMPVAISFSGPVPPPPQYFKNMDINFQICRAHDWLASHP